jgi:hypothetical protein
VNRREAEALVGGEVVRVDRGGRYVLGSKLAVVEGPMVNDRVTVEYSDGRKGKAWFGRLQRVKAAAR